MQRLPPFVRFLAAFLFLAVLVGGGTLGFSRIEGWPLPDSLYMTIITITTVGFGEVRPLSPPGRQFTMLLLVCSVLTLGYSVTVLIGFIFEGQILQTLKERRMRNALRRLKGHYIVCGGGNTGSEVAQELRRAKERFVVIERDLGGTLLGGDSSILLLEGDATEDEVLERAGIGRARGLVATLPDDEDNVFIVLSARQLNPSLKIVAQASDGRAVRKLVKAGADKVISPKQIAGRRLASLILRPSLVNFLDVMTGGGRLSMRIEEVEIPVGSPVAGKTLCDAGIGRHTGAVIVGIVDTAGKVLMNPSSATTLSGLTITEGDALVALGSEEQLKQLREFLARGHRAR